MANLKDLTPKFHQVRLLLVREKGHPEGDREEGYDDFVTRDERPFRMKQITINHVRIRPTDGARLDLQSDLAHSRHGIGPVDQFQGVPTPSTIALMTRSMFAPETNEADSTSSAKPNIRRR